MFAPVHFKKTSYIFFEEVYLLGALFCYLGVGSSSPPWCQYLAPTLQLGMWAPFQGRLQTQQRLQHSKVRNGMMLCLLRCASRKLLVFSLRKCICLAYCSVIQRLAVQARIGAHIYTTLQLGMWAPFKVGYRPN